MNHSANKNIVWVMGPSAAGKETFIRHISDDADLAANLGLATPVVPGEASLRYIKQSPDDPIAERRDEILDEVPRLLKMANTVVNKWQLVDTDSHRLGRLQALTPGVGHMAVVLQVSPDELMEQRLPTKPWWGTYGYADWVTDELPKIAESVEALPADFTVVHVQSGGSNNYAIVNAPRISASV